MKRSTQRNLLMAGALVVVTIAPVMLETRASARVVERLARCPDGTTGCGGIESIDLDLSGLRLEEVWVQRRGWTGGGRSVRVGPDWSGVRVDVREPWLRRTAERDRPPTTSSPTEAPTTTGQAPPRRTLPQVRVTIAAVGELVVRETPVGTVTLRDPIARWRPDAPLQLQAEGAIEHAWGRVETVGPMRARVSTGPRRRIVGEGVVSLGGGAPTAVTTELVGDDLQVALDDGAGGHLELTAQQRTRLAIRARAFALGRLGTWAERAASRFGVVTAGTTLDGAIDLERGPARQMRAHVHETTLEGLRIEHPKLSSDPIELDALTLAGDLSWQSEQLQAQLTLVHRGAQLHVAATRTPEVLELDAELPRTSCQVLFDAIPEALTGVVDGTRYAGDLDGRLSFSLDFGALAEARRRPEQQADAPPGSVDLAFEPFERCTVVADAPQIDLAALRGPYRHRFLDDRGHPHERVMTTGAPHYVRLSAVPLVARSFSMLEDTRFWKHDGFDREQIERALWHNLVVGRVDRGASTITQQAARCLWLGIDRALARKFQEALLASRLEQAVDKERILELYLNVIELGPEVHGVADAAEYYFGKPAHALDVLEALHVASMAPAPRALAKRFATGEVDETWMEHLHRHVRRMHLHGYITNDELLLALRSPLRLRVHRTADPSEAR